MLQHYGIIIVKKMHCPKQIIIQTTSPWHFPGHTRPSLHFPRKPGLDKTKSVCLSYAIKNTKHILGTQFLLLLIHNHAPAVLFERN